MERTLDIDYFTELHGIEIYSTPRSEKGRTPLVLGDVTPEAWRRTNSLEIVAVDPVVAHQHETRVSVWSCQL